MKKRLLVLFALCFCLLAGCEAEEGKETPADTPSPVWAQETVPTDILMPEPTATNTPTPTSTPTPTPHEHSYTGAVTKEATCEADGQGEMTYTCSCGDIYTEELPKLPHTESDWMVVTEVTATSDGLQHKVCTVCGEETASEVISCETFVVASGAMEGSSIEWEIVGTTLYVRGEGAIPGFPYNTSQSRSFPDIYPWDELIAWQPYDEIVEKIVIEEGITKIGKNNFASLKKVKEIIFADSVTEVGQYGCMSLGVEDLDFNKITVLGFEAFGCLKNLESLTVPGTIKNISAACFAFCDNLSEVYIEEGVESIAESAFFVASGHSDCHIHLPSTMKDFGTTVKDYGAEPVFSWDSTLYVKSGSYAEKFLTEYLEFHKDVWKGEIPFTVIVE